MYKIVLVRHGESIWNKENKFTGWTDVGLSKKGITESKQAGQILKKEGYNFDIAFCSVLKRAIQTLEYLLREMQLKLPTKYSWRLNEKHYGALQGLNKSEKAKEVGEDQVFKWRRVYDCRPPPLSIDDPRHPIKEILYKEVNRKDLPDTECLKDVVDRVLLYWKNDVSPVIKSGKKVIISAHGNSIRALVKHLDNIPDEEIPHLNIPTGIPLVYELDEALKPIKHYYLGNKEEVEKQMQVVKNQGKA